MTVTSFSILPRVSDAFGMVAAPGASCLPPPSGAEIRGVSGHLSAAYAVLQLRRRDSFCAAAPRKWVTISGDRAMDDIPCQDFFLHPSQVLHRQYEAIRAVFVEHQPLPQVAPRFGYSYGSLRNLVADFRARCRAGQAPPFSPNRSAVGHTASAPIRRPASPRPPPRLTVANSPSPRDVACAPALPGSSCSCPC
jgi:hypothetical protein